MSGKKLEKIKLREAEILSKHQTMSIKLIDINDKDDFNKLLKNFPEKVVVIDFWAIWCAPCKVYAPIFEKIYQEYSNDFIFIKINVDVTPNIAQDFGITSIPTTLLLKGGEILRKFVGVVNYKTLKQIIERFR